MELDAYTQGLMIEAVRETVARMQSPWLDRKHAGFYCHCAPSEVDRGADAGAFKRYYRAGTPMFKKSEIDAAIAEGKWLKRARGGAGFQVSGSKFQVGQAEEECAGAHR